MKASVIAIAILATVTSAWKVDIYTTDNRHSTMHGTRDSGCKNIAFTPTMNINRVNFNPATSLYPDPSTVEFYVNNNCDGLSYRNGGGDHRISPRKVKSYKVY